VRLRVLSYNIHKCIGGIDRLYRPERIVTTIEAHAPDLVLLQECANGGGNVDGYDDLPGGDGSGSGPAGPPAPRRRRRGLGRARGRQQRWHRQVDLLGEALGFRHRTWFANHQYRRGGEYGNAILSRWPITHSENIVVSVPGTKARSVLHARVRARTSTGRVRTVHVFCMHLGLTERSREQQLRAFLDSHPFAGLHARTPILVAGDLNDVWGTIGPRYLRPAGFQGMDKRLRTFPAWAPVQALDAIYVRGDARMTPVQRCSLPLARVASDHLPLFTELSFAP
jgi:endonuclease/exonuclease/phosphatase family metal-dependent hydrolase